MATQAMYGKEWLYVCRYGGRYHGVHMLLILQAGWSSRSGSTIQSVGAGLAVRQNAVSY